MLLAFFMGVVLLLGRELLNVWVLLDVGELDVGMEKEEMVSVSDLLAVNLGCWSLAVAM